MDLSILIPALNEKHLRQTVADIMRHSEGDTEIIVGLDGYDDDLPDISRLRIHKVEKTIGQRAMMNELAKLSTARYIMKTDAHCSFSQGFDVEMMNLMQDLAENTISGTYHSNVLMSPVFCGLDTENWQVISKPRQVCGRFDKEFIFQWWPEYENGQKPLQETLAIHGSCFIVARENYWKWNLCDEKWGSWGRQGTEVSIKTWLNGGRVVTNRNAYYGHMFRGKEDFPYERDMEQIKKTKEFCEEFLTNPKFQQLLDKFKPIPEWH